MEISQKDLDEFKQIYKEDYGEELNDAEARRLAVKLISFLKIIAEIISQKH